MKLKAFISALEPEKIPSERKDILQKLIDHIKEKHDSRKEIKLNFICTHNSRRSQLAQAWAAVAASHYEIPVQTFSGGVEVTAFHPNAVQALQNDGLELKPSEDDNPVYEVTFGNDDKLYMFSKLFDDEVNPEKDFAAIMVCDHADENCPFIPGANRISLTYEDPKIYDGTGLQEEKYSERSRQIATELFYVFSKVKKK